MSEFHVRVVRISGVERHPNADRLSITQVDGGYPVIFQTEDFNEGDLAVYVPIDSVVPELPEWEFLRGHRRIKAKKLRGIFSMGLLAPLPALKLPRCGLAWAEGMDAQVEMGIVRYEAPMRTLIVYSDNEPDPGFFPRYSDLEGLRKCKDVLELNEPVVLTEKIHGANARFAWHEGRLWVGSHNHFKKRPVPGAPVDIWWRAAAESFLEEKLATMPGVGFYGEVYGRVQDLNYGVVDGVEVRFFDAIDLQTGRYYDYQEFLLACIRLGLYVVPALYTGPWLGFDGMKKFAEGTSTLNGASHVREGFVVRSVVERFDRRCGRVALKLHGEGYMLRKEA